MHTRHEQLTLRYVEATAPGSEPVSVADVKAHRRIDADDDSQNATIAILIGAARRYAEAYTGQTFIERTWRAVADRFPRGCLLPRQHASAATWYAGELPADRTITLQHGPVVSVDAIQYVDSTGASLTLDPTKYVVDLSGLRPRIAPAFGTDWPETRQQIGAVTINFTAGYGPVAANVPEQFRNWILVRVGTLYENREETTVVARGRIEAVPFLDALLELDRVPVL